jgi:hypothetical protein
MSLYVIDHETEGRVVFNTETQTYRALPKTSGKLFVGGKPFDYFDSLSDFIQSDSAAAIILCYCIERKQVGKRDKVVLITYTERIEFFNVEKIDTGWLKHEIELFKPEKGYLVYFIREKDCMNGARIKSVKEANIQKKYL